MGWVRRLRCWEKQNQFFIIGSGADDEVARSQVMWHRLLNVWVSWSIWAVWPEACLAETINCKMRHKRREATGLWPDYSCRCPEWFQTGLWKSHRGRRFISVNRSKTDLFKNKRPTLPFLVIQWTFDCLSDYFSRQRSEWFECYTAQR